MTPNASILLLNEIVLPARCIPLQMALWDVQMMAVVGGRERTQSDWRSLVENVGNYGAKQDVKLEIIRIWTPPNNQGEGIIEIVRRQ